MIIKWIIDNRKDMLDKLLKLKDVLFNLFQKKVYSINNLIWYLTGLFLVENFNEWNKLKGVY